MRAERIGFLLLMLAITGCGQSTIEQTLRPDQTALSNKNALTTKKRGLVVTDNPYTISSDRLEQMNKGGFGTY